MTHDTHGDLDAILNDRDALVPGEPPLVLATNWELLDVLEGRELTFSTDDGGKVRIRLYNPDELLDAQRRMWADQPDGDAHAAAMTRQKAIELCMPLSEIMRRQVRRPS